jgi:hypothetical protein
LQLNILLAVLLQTVGSFFFAYSAYMQDRVVVAEVSENGPKAKLDWPTLWESMKSPRWLAGLALLGASLVCQITALSLAPVSIVQPVGVLAFPWSMIIQSRKHKVPVPTAARVAAVGTVLAIGGFIIVGGINAAPESNDLDPWRVVIGAGVVYLVAAALGFIGSRGPNQWRCLFWASGGAVFYGLEASLVKSLMEFAKQTDWVHAPAFWGTLVALVIGSATAGWMVQHGYASGPAELVVASMTITSPVVAVIWGIAVLGEGAHLDPVSATLMILLGAAAITGVIRLTTVHPHFDDDGADQAAVAEA